MKKALKIALPIASALAAAAAVTVFAAAPGRARESKKAPFMGRNIAHRGLHRTDGSVAENSLSAFRAAVDGGYAIECDVRLTRDGRAVVFHDEDTGRMCASPGKVEEMNWSELSKLRLGRTRDTVPLLSDVLAVAGGKAPVVLELKSGGRDTELCERVYELVRCYSGPVCVQSFNPLLLRWWRKNAPEILRGQLSAPEKKLGGVSRLRAFALANLLGNFLCRPQFISYGVCGKRLPLMVRLCSALGAMKFCWTSRDRSSEDYADAVIFEFYRPRIRFK
ncbi:MAG: glycerophosphodiester phosphodiesterase [Butyricicoccus sp.]|nr:glycerophosphodiester phosphodiesterase [Butyricicoccus sp.]